MLQQAIAICSRTVYHRNDVPVVSLTLIHAAGLLPLFSWVGRENEPNNQFGLMAEGPTRRRRGSFGLLVKAIKHQ